ncbi:hypothetical protein GCM10012275_02230 [Longimycelium tulufanense]|uniref:DUF3558 domain-containing protein n=1 Tax=Longimycelium tulufanense TaxID=907463 RepID=A0A8J3FUF0_9PSEU|nr:DUF3558 domain-containing protein [Longimycelium tulufanense]GGM34468.1 hypothetical protein GCM10012275_02230 [Longimycelium tulufanense]
MRRFLLVPAMCAVAALTASCANPSPGAPTTTDGTGAPGSGTTQTSRLSPPLAEPPLDTTSFEKDPCTLLRPDQVKQFGESEPPKPKNGLTGPSCTWDPESVLKTGTLGISVTAEINTKSGGLEGIYQRRDKFGLFEKTEVGGYPGVHALDDKGGPANGKCTSLIGISEDRLVVTYVFINDKKISEYTTACRVSDRAAGMVIENLKGAK